MQLKMIIMKHLLILFTFFYTSISFSQTNPPPPPPPPPADWKDMPSFPGGETEMNKFILDNIQYPEKERLAGISGTCYITFVVEKNGCLSDIKILRGIPNGAGCDAEALRVVAKMPKWSPVKLNGQEVRVQFTLPIKFTLMNARKYKKMKRKKKD